MIFTPLPFESDLKPGGPTYPEAPIAIRFWRGFGESGESIHSEPIPCVRRAERMGLGRFVVTMRSPQARWLLMSRDYAPVFWKEPPHAAKLRRIHTNDAMRRWRWEWMQVFEAAPAPGETPLPPGAPRLLAFVEDFGRGAWLGPDLRPVHRSRGAWQTDWSQGEIERDHAMSQELLRLWADEESSLRQSWLACQMSDEQHEAYQEARARAARGPSLLGQAAIGLRRLLGIRP